MTTYTTIASTSIDQDSPVVQPVMQALRDNPIAISEGSTDAPINQTGWHPYDMVNVGDGADGVIYDHSVDGTVASVVTPDFADGYEYIFLYSGISPSILSNFQVEEYLETSASYDTAVILDSSVDVSSTVSGWLNLALDRFQRIPIMNGKTEKVLKYRFSFSDGNIDAGTIAIYRRREFISG